VSVVRDAALQALRQVVVTAAAGLVDPQHVFAEDAEPDVRACYPNVAIDTQGSFTFDPFDADEVDASAPTTVTVHVGDFVGQVRIRVGSESKTERRKIGEAILQVFLNTPGKSGVLVVQLTGLVVGGVTLAAQVPVAFRLGDTMWDEEMVFDRKRFQNLVLDVELPALVTWTDTYDINSMVLAFTEDLTSATPDTVQVAVTADGDLEAYP
jgi:hypothetical protein